MNNKLFTFLTLAMLATLNLQLSTLHAQGTAFTYQGRLTDNGNPANGDYDLTFAVFDALSAGAQVGINLTNAPTPVSNGLFTVTLDFGTGIFPGSPRWLEIGVATNGGGSFATLSPRQALLPAPYAIHASTAADVAAGAVVKSLNALKDDVTLAAGSNVTITPSGNTLTIASTGAGIWNLNGTNTFFNAGNVGIGTNAPSHRLSIAGGPFWTTYSWKGAIDLENAAAIGWHGNAGGQRFGIGQSTGGLYFFRTTSEPGTTATVANYDLEITDSGNLLVGGGGENGNKLQVNGGAFFASGGSGGNVSIGSPNAESGLTISGSARADIRFDGTSLKLFAGPAGGPPSGGVAINTSGNVGIGTTTPSRKLEVISSGIAIYGSSTGSEGVHGQSSGSSAGVNGTSSGNGPGVYGISGSGYAGYFAGTVLAEQRISANGGITASGSPAGSFIGNLSVSGNLTVSGTVSKSGGTFKIDHPLDPANKYLSHSFVESPDMMNVYNGNTNLDANGEATVQMPEWFESLNKDFRYQLTAIGAPGPNLYIAEEVTDNHFKIAGGSAGAKVSWQVTGIRQDAWASTHRIQVEEEKPGNERGTYLHPELFGQPAEKDVF